MLFATVVALNPFLAYGRAPTRVQDEVRESNISVVSVFSVEVKPPVTKYTLNNNYRKFALKKIKFPTVWDPLKKLEHA